MQGIFPELSKVSHRLPGSSNWSVQGFHPWCVQKVCREDVGSYNGGMVAQAAGAWGVLSLGEEKDLSLYI